MRVLTYRIIIVFISYYIIPKRPVSKRLRARLQLQLRWL